MNIQTKYKVGEQVWTINDNGKIVQFTINSITVDIYKDGSVEVLYHEEYNPQEMHSMLRDENATKTDGYPSPHHNPMFF